MHEHVQVELKESGFYPEKLGLELVKSAQKTLGAASKEAFFQLSLLSNLVPVGPSLSFERVCGLRTKS